MSLSPYWSIIPGPSHTYLTYTIYGEPKITDKYSLPYCEWRIHSSGSCCPHRAWRGPVEVPTGPPPMLPAFWISLLPPGCGGILCNFLPSEGKMKRYDWDTQCIEVKIKEHKHTIWNATRDMSARAASTLALENLWSECWNLNVTKEIYIRMDNLNVWSCTFLKLWYCSSL